MGALGAHINLQLKRGVKILTCNPATRLIEAETRNGEVITVNVYNYTPMFRWPIPGEKWMVGEENGSWYLEGIYEPQGTETSEVQAEPGDAIISASSGRILKNVEGQLSVLGSTEVTKWTQEPKKILSNHHTLEVKNDTSRAWLVAFRGEIPEMGGRGLFELSIDKILFQAIREISISKPYFSGMFMVPSNSTLELFFKLEVTSEVEPVSHIYLLKAEIT